MKPVRTVHRRRRLVKAPEREFLGYGCWLLTCGTRGRAPLFRDRAGWAETVLHAAAVLAPQSGLVLDAMCVMPDHVHLLVQAARRAVREPRPFLETWRRATTRVCIPGPGALWHDAHRERELTQPVDHCLALDYVVQNPVRAELASEWTDYEWTFSRFHAETPWRPAPPPTNGGSL